MAKGNLLLGTARNSVGDVVMYRREGSQVSRVRVRKIGNPKTTAQSAQRSLFAPVAKFFSPLAVVLERSFEGLSKAKSYSKFLQDNIKLARTNGWLLPKGTGFFPLPYKLSKGTLPTVGYSLDGTSHALEFTSPAAAAGATTIGDLSTLFINAGYAAGDVVTIIICVKDADGNYFPIAEQFTIDATSTDLIAGAFGNMVLTIDNSSKDKLTVNSGLGQTDAGAIIVARFENEKWRRSTQVLDVDSAVVTAVTDATAKAASAASYGANANGGNPLVYLDGEEEVFQ